SDRSKPAGRAPESRPRRNRLGRSRHSRKKGRRNSAPLFPAPASVAVLRLLLLPIPPARTADQSSAAHARETRSQQGHRQRFGYHGGRVLRHAEDEIVKVLVDLERRVGFADVLEADGHPRERAAEYLLAAAGGYTGMDGIVEVSRCRAGIMAAVRLAERIAAGPVTRRNIGADTEDYLIAHRQAKPRPRAEGKGT